jgi:hypothetical protein
MASQTAVADELVALEALARQDTAGTLERIRARIDTLERKRPTMAQLTQASGIVGSFAAQTVARDKAVALEQELGEVKDELEQVHYRLERAITREKGGIEHLSEAPREHIYEWQLLAIQLMLQADKLHKELNRLVPLGIPTESAVGKAKAVLESDEKITEELKTLDKIRQWLTSC